MAALDCLNDSLTRALNARRFQPVLMPSTNLVAPEVWVYDNDALVRWGPLSLFVPAGTLPAEREAGEMPDLAHTETSRKGASAGGSFLETALRCIGIDSAPKLDLSFAHGSDVTFSFAGITTRGLPPGLMAGALANFQPGIIPASQVAAGMVHIAYEYAYAAALNMHFAAATSGSFNIKAIKIADFIDVGGKADVHAANETTLQFTATAAPVAFAFKIGPLRRHRGKWEFRATEILGQGATADESGEPQAYLLRRGAVLIGEDKDMKALAE